MDSMRNLEKRIEERKKRIDALRCKGRVATQRLTELYYEQRQDTLELIKKELKQGKKANCV